MTDWTSREYLGLNVILKEEFEEMDLMKLVADVKSLNGVWETGSHSRARGGCHVSTLFESGRDKVSFMKLVADLKSLNFI